MRRQLMCVMLTAAVLVGGVVQAQAAQRTGTIRVMLDYGSGQNAEAALSLCQVAEAAENGYRLRAAFGGGMIKREDAQSPDLALWLAERCAEGGIEQHLGKDGYAEYTELPEGLYLLVQTETPEGFLPVNPFLIEFPYRGTWELVALPKSQAILTESPQTGQHPAPLIGAMGLVLAGMGLAVCFEKMKRK